MLIYTIEIFGKPFSPCNISNPFKASAQTKVILRSNEQKCVQARYINLESNSDKICNMKENLVCRFYKQAARTGRRRARAERVTPVAVLRGSMVLQLSVSQLGEGGGQ